MATLTTNVIMPVLGMSQDSGKIIQWLKAEGQLVNKGEPLMEVETDKAVVEIEAPATGILSQVSARDGDEVPVTQVVAVIVSTGAGQPPAVPQAGSPVVAISNAPAARKEGTGGVAASPVAARMAAEHQLDLSVLKPQGGRVEKADVLAYLKAQEKNAAGHPAGRIPASPKARRLAAERGIDLVSLSGSGPGGAILAGDVLSAAVPPAAVSQVEISGEPSPASQPSEQEAPVSTVWRIMSERLSAAWSTVPHFYLLREVNASRLMAWREKIQDQSAAKITVTDLLVKLTAAALHRNPRVNAAYKDSKIFLQAEVNIGLAVAVEDGLVVPVIHQAGDLSLSQIATRRAELVERARAGRLRPDDLSGGTFTISNLGMFGVDAFNAVINPPQAAILAVGRIVDRIVPLNGQPAIQPMLVLSASFDHRVVDGARGAQFLQTLADLIEEPLGLLV